MAEARCVKNMGVFTIDKEGILIARDKEAVSYVETDDRVLERLNKRAEKDGWKDAAMDFLQDDARMSAKYLTDPRRADFLYALPTFNEKETALDIGSGMGSILCELAGVYKTVYANDLSYQRLLFSKIRMEQEGRHNGVYINESFAQIDFAVDSFDLVVVNGVLEWIPFSYPETVSPYEAQLDFLSRVYRVLKKNGVLYVGIENRFSKEALLGAPDPHTGVRFNSVVPRRIASLMVRRRFRPTMDNRFYRMEAQRLGYRNYTYSCAGYRRLLKEAGFSRILIHATFPNYNKPESIFSVDGKLARQYAHYATRNLFLRRLYKVFPPLVALLAPAYAIFAIR